MSDPDDKKPPKERSAEPTAVGPQGGDKRSGRVAYDARGNPIWEWQLETGVYSRDVNTQRLKMLDLGDLSIAETAKHPKLPGPDDAPGKPLELAPAPGSGSNPYDNSPVRNERGSNPYDNARALSKKLETPAAKPAAPKPRSAADLKRIEEWMKIKQRVEEQKKKEDEED